MDPIPAGDHEIPTHNQHREATLVVCGDLVITGRAKRGP